MHFGERGSIAWPINWNGASRAAEKADMILCLGSSLKVSFSLRGNLTVCPQVLRRYPWLWCMDRPAKQRPPLYIVNLQWTPKDSAATLKLNGRCDFVLAEVLKHLRMKLPEYLSYNDPLLSYATHLHEKEEHTTSRRTLIESRPVGVTQLSMEASVSPTGVITEVRVSNKFTSAKSEFSYMSSERQPSSSHLESSRAASPAPELPGSPQPSPGDSSYYPSSASSAASQAGGSAPASPTPRDQHNGHDSPAEAQTNGHCSNGLSNGARRASWGDSDAESQTKKPKIESPRDSDCDSDSDFDASQDQVNLLGSGSYPSPFPSPDHNYAISPVKLDPSEVRAETEQDVKEEEEQEEEEKENKVVKEEPKEEEGESQPSRYRVSFYFFC